MGVLVAQTSLCGSKRFSFETVRITTQRLCYLNRPSAPLTRRARHFFSGRSQANAYHLLDRPNRKRTLSSSRAGCARATGQLDFLSWLQLNVRSDAVEARQLIRRQLMGRGNLGNRITLARANFGQTGSAGRVWGAGRSLPIRQLNAAVGNYELVGGFQIDSTIQRLERCHADSGAVGDRL